jgi:hypothetical protein
LTATPKIPQKRVQITQKEGRSPISSWLTVNNLLFLYVDLALLSLMGSSLLQKTRRYQNNKYSGTLHQAIGHSCTRHNLADTDNHCNQKRTVGNRTGSPIGNIACDELAMVVMVEGDFGYVVMVDTLDDSWKPKNMAKESTDQ